MTDSLLLFVMNDEGWNNAERVIDIFAKKLYCTLTRTVDCTKNIDFASYLIQNQKNTDKFNYTAILRDDNLTLVFPNYKEIRVDNLNKIHSFFT